MMTIAQRMENIQSLLKKADAQLLEQIEHILVEHTEQPGSVLTASQKKELLDQEAAYNSGRGKVYSWQDIKQELIEKYGLPA